MHNNVAVNMQCCRLVVPMIEKCMKDVEKFSCMIAILNEFR